MAEKVLSQSVNCPATLGFSCALPEISPANRSVPCVYFHKCWRALYNLCAEPCLLVLTLPVCWEIPHLCIELLHPHAPVSWQWVLPPSSQCPVSVFSTTLFLCSKLVQFKTDWLGGKVVPESALGFDTVPVFCTNCSDSIPT